jgi:mono/diheme cytochrome c family protein
MATRVGFVALLVLVGGAFGAVWGLTAQRAAEPPAPPPAFAGAPGEEEPPRRAPEAPRAAFGHMCGTCHTLRAANATGVFGPDLDEVGPSAAHVRRMIRTGSRDGIMPSRLLRGREARDVAEYVARVAGRSG